MVVLLKLAGLCIVRYAFVMARLNPGDYTMNARPTKHVPGSTPNWITIDSGGTVAAKFEMVGLRTYRNLDAFLSTYGLEVESLSPGKPESVRNL